MCLPQVLTTTEKESMAGFTTHYSTKLTITFQLLNQKHCKLIAHMDHGLFEPKIPENSGASY